MIIQSQNMCVVLNSDQIIGYSVYEKTPSKCNKPYKIVAWSAIPEEEYILGEYKTKEEAQVILDSFAANLVAGVRFHCFAAEDVEDDQ